MHIFMSDRELSGTLLRILQPLRIGKKNGAEDDLILSCSFSYHQPFLIYNGSKYLKTHPSPLFFGKYCPGRSVQGSLN